MASSLLNNVLFYVFGALAVVLALMAVTSTRILRAAVYLMGVLILTAGFYMLLGAEFLAGVQVLVYVGGIVVLLVFAVMLTHSLELLDGTPKFERKLLSASAAILFLMVSVGSFLSMPITLSSTPGAMAGATKEIGRKLLDNGAQGYVLPFELISALLLAALIGGIVIARKTPHADSQGGCR